MSCPVPDRTGETWEEVPREEHKWTPGYTDELERFVIVGKPRLLPHGIWENPEGWYYPVLWLDDVALPTKHHKDDDGINATHCISGRYVRLG